MTLRLIYNTSMDIYRHLLTNPIRKFVSDGGFTSIFRTIGFIGDSLSSGEHESFSEEVGTGYHDYYEYSWGQYIARRCGLKAYNFSRGGLTAIEFFSFVTSDHPSAINIFDEDKKCQAYVIALGVNDLNHLEEKYDAFGSINDVDFSNEDNNKKTFVGCYVKIIQKIRKIQPKCRVFVMTTPKERPMKKVKKSRYKMLAKFLRTLPKYFDFLYVLDLWNYAPVYNAKSFKTKYFCGGHMSAAGYKFTADMVMTYIDYYVRKYPKDFTQAGFIGKNVHNSKEKW